MTTVTVKKDGVDVELLILEPTQPMHAEAQKWYNSAFNDAINPGGKHKPALMRVAMDEVLRRQGVWNDAKELEARELRENVSSLEKVLVKGGIRKSEGHKTAMELRKARYKLLSLLGTRNAGDDKTAEGIAEQAKFDYLLTQCLVYNDTKRQPFYKSVEDYLNRKADESSYTAASKFAEVYYGLNNSDYQEKLPENKFLKRFKYVDDKFRLIRADGRLVDEGGKLVNEDGRYVDEDNNLVDASGNRVDESGDFVVEPQPFLDEDGQPLSD